MVAIAAGTSGHEHDVGDRTRASLKARRQCHVDVRRAKVGLNLIGMKRAGIARESIHVVRGAYKELFSGSRPIQEVAAEMRETASDQQLIDLLDFVTSAKDRALCTPANS